MTLGAIEVLVNTFPADRLTGEIVPEIARPGLVGTMARTAVIAGTATAVSGSVHNTQVATAQAAADRQATSAELAATQAQLAELQPRQVPPAARHPPARTTS